MTYKDILKIVPTMQAASLAKHNYDFAKKSKGKGLAKNAVSSIVGINLIKATSVSINDL